MCEYETRDFHGVTHFYMPVYGGNGKAVALALHEPDKKERRFLIETDKPKVTEIKI